MDLLHNSPKPSRRESTWGWISLVISLFALPYLLQAGNRLLSAPLTGAQLNFVYYCANFLLVLLAFPGFLRQSVSIAFRRLLPTLWYAGLGYLANTALVSVLMRLFALIGISFANVNDQNVMSLVAQGRILMIIGVVFLVPVAEETFYRGLIFRNLYSKNHLLAYLVSMAVFAAIHVMGYIGSYAPLHLLLCFMQYLPAGFCLAWCYRQTGTLLTPILMHMLVNAYGIAAIV